MKFLLTALLVIAPALRAEPSIMAVPTAATTNQVITIVAVELPLDSIWSLSGGEWCQFASCKWRSDEDLSAEEASHPLWRATAAGTYTITLTPPTGSAVTVTVVVTEP